MYEKLLATLVRLYPSSFRQRYGEQAFKVKAADALSTAITLTPNVARALLPAAPGQIPALACSHRAFPGTTKANQPYSRACDCCCSSSSP
jgi:hypothetical protein